jgi:hypothetical protein
VLEGYFDDSGGEELGVVAVGGFVATRQAWSVLFEPSWRSFLARNGLSYFRMAEFESRFGDYAGWSNERRIRELQEALTLVTRTVRLGVGVAIDVEAYRRYSPSFDEIIGWPVTPFHLCAHFAVTLVEGWRTKNGEGKVAYTFEAGSEGEPAFLRTMQALADAMPEGFHEDEPARIGGKLDHVQLHAADFLAYETFKAARRRLGIDKLPDRQSLIALLEHEGVDYEEALMSDKHFEWMLDAANRED